MTIKQSILTAILTAISVAASIKLSDEGFVGCKNVGTQLLNISQGLTIQRCFGKLNLKLEDVKAPQ